MSQTHCYICNRQLSVDREIVGYMETRYFTACQNPQCDGYGAEVAEASVYDFYPSDIQMGIRA